MHVTEEILRELALLEQSERTVLSVYLDLKRGWDNAEAFIEKEATKLKNALSDEELEYFEASLEFFLEYIAKKKAERFSGPGLTFFADLGAGYAKGVMLTISHKPLLAVDDQALILPLAMELDEYEPVGVIMADASGARIMISAGKLLEDEEDVNVKIHHLSKVGGWSQMRYQRRRDKQVLHFAKEVADSADRLFRKEGVKRILMAGRDRILTSIEAEFPHRWRDAIIDTIRWDLSSPDDEFMRKITPALVKAERDQETMILDRFIGEFRRNGLATAGVENTTTALQLGQVDILLLDMDLDETLSEELTSMAEATSAHVEFIPPIKRELAQFGGVGALLRYKIG